MADDKKGAKILAFMTGALKGYGKIRADQEKIKADILSNQLQAKQNWFFKMQEQKAQQNAQEQRVQSAFQGGAKEAGYTMGYSPTGGRTLNPPSQQIIRGKIYQAVKAKQARGEKLDERDQRLIDSYEGAGAEKQPFTSGKVETVLGNLQNKGMRDPYNNIIPFGNKTRAIEYVRSQLGPNWRELEPRAGEIIDKNYRNGGNPEERYNELIKVMPSEEAYAQLIEEGF